MKYLLDANVCIEILRGNSLIRNKLSNIKVRDCALSEITVLELKIGEELARRKSYPNKYVDQHLNDFINDFKIIPISNCLDFFASEKVRLQLAGTPVHNNFDLLIGCTAVVNGLIMVTDNIKDFQRISNIKLDNWKTR